MTFDELGLSPELLRAVGDAGYIIPTPIQEQAIPVILTGRDVFGCAQTGTGKTASFTLPMIDILAAGRAKARMPRSLIIEPTRELAAQVEENFATYGKYHKLTTALLIGGESFVDQQRALGRGVDVLIVTPGRMLDLFERGRILLSDLRILAIDEADRMLDMGFFPDIEKIVGLLPPLRQTLFFSATMPPEIRRLADKFLHNPKQIMTTPSASTAENVDQRLVAVDQRHKRDALIALIGGEAVTSALIFCNRKRDVATLAEAIRRKGFNAGALHGDMVQSKRTETLEAFRTGKITFLVASDVAARGLDIDDVSHVLNFDVPTHPEDYVHRIGRTARAGRSGVAVTLATPDDAKFVAAIEKLIRKPIPRHIVSGSVSPPAASDDAAQAPTAIVGAGETPRQERHPTARPHASRDGRRRGREGQRPEPETRTVPAMRHAENAAQHDESISVPRDHRRTERLPAASAQPEQQKGPRPVVLGLGDHVPAFFLRGSTPGRNEAE